ncbi:MAG: isoprenyl transferase [Ruminococcus sp.]|nr:isoprenyl transferase [Ruminococcus sp.]
MAFLSQTPKQLPPPEQLPQHIGFIMDGNGRWAKKRGLPRKFGHREGAKTFKKIVRYCRNLGIRYISFYAFSTENWKRPEDEVNAIMKLFDQYIDDVRGFFDEETRMVFLGDKSKFTDSLQKKMYALEADTAHYDQMTLMIAANYGGRDEIAHAARALAEQVKAGTLNPEDITEDSVSANLYTAGIPDVDLLIRPSGELRLSNYLIWQTAYAEFYFTDVLWPDFDEKQLDRALIDFASRNRRFGGV